MDDLYGAKMKMMNWMTFIAPYCENYTSRAFYKDCTKDIPNKYVFNCHLNESIVGISLMLSGRLFQAVGPTTQKVRSPNLVQDDRLWHKKSNARCRHRS